MAADILTKYHGEDDILWDGDGQLEGLERRFQEQNGGLSERQLAWLERELADSDSRREKVLVYGHCCLHPSSCDPTCLLWNYDEVQNMFARHPCVVAYLSGHAHNAGHGKDDLGIHYLVFHGVIETSPDSQAFATLSLFDDCLVVDGKGTEPSMVLPLAERYPAEEEEGHSLAAASLCCIESQSLQEEQLMVEAAEKVADTCHEVSVQV